MPLSLIPQVFFDLIARVIPGCVLVITGYLTILGPKKAIDAIVSASATQSIVNFWSLVLLIIFAYVSGLIFNELWYLTFEKIRSTRVKENHKRYLGSCIAEYNKIRKCFGESELSLRGKDLPPVHVMHDHVRLRSQSEAYRLLKLRAEVYLFDTLFTGFMVLAMTNILVWYHDAKLFALDRAALELAMMVVMLTFWRGGDKLEKFYRNGTCMAWLLLSFPIGPQEQMKGEKNRLA